MPWCDDCEKYWAPSSMTHDGHCPRCDADLERPEPLVGVVADSAAAGAEAADEKVPWHFKLMVVALVVYLGYRFFEIFFA